ncbi:hypothetical protein BV921_20430 [Pectobacterium odoriferum]|uniref:TumA n=2 Tax=Pectobacterium TaxID=122277 RepID=A0AAP9IE74_9GAMM|nr:hypothetical protein [Pectobacterium odoriferum]KGA39339.1 TumA [Pectobacterium odoriferum]POE07275.1 hypothetical protein BV921_20430 [Pectobacterium odoriferum]QHP81452.1 hypothetical protein EO763_16945 [Pectobacterium odoriferum]QHQ22849.1 hypothetical protein GMX10_01135 [Pectobacterium parvum]
MENTEHIQAVLSRVQLIADISLVAQCDVDELKTAMSIIADLANGTIETREYRQITDKSELVEYLKKRLEEAVF